MSMEGRVRDVVERGEESADDINDGEERIRI